MSDTSQGPGWWLASDGKWYPPQSAPAYAAAGAPAPTTASPTDAPPQQPPYQQPQYQQPTAPPPQYQQQTPVVQPAKNNKGCLIALLIVVVLIVLAVVGSIAGIAFLGNKAEDKLEALGSSLETPAVDPSDPGARSDDRYVQIGDGVELSGYTTTVEDGGYQQTLGDITFDQGFLYGYVTVRNRDSDPQPVSIFDWKLQTPSGELLDPYSTNNEEQLVGTELVEGGQVEGKVIFHIDDRKGDFFLIYKPDPLTKTRGIWKVTIGG